VPGLAGLQLEAETAEFAVRLRLDPVEGVVLQGDAGLSAKGPGQASYYYSVPRLAAAGEIRVGSKVVAVRGGAWLDREWSTSVLGEAQVGWDWFALQLDAGAELMAFQLRRRDGTRDPYDQGLWVPEDGPAEHLDADEFTLEPLRWWTDDAGVRWPVAWALVVEGPGGARRLRVEAALDDQRMDTLLTYWEGLVRVFDEAGRRIGTGYMELTGYE
jgi:predicted secreted hydrolase